MADAAARRRPTRASAALAVVAAALGTLLVGDPAAVPLAVVLVGVVTMAAGDELRSRGRRTWAVSTLGVGVAVAFVGVAAVVALADEFPDVLRTLPGLLGVLALGVGLAPVRGRGSRRLVKVGAGLVLVGVLFAGLLRSVGTGTLVAGAVAAVVGWDLGEHAVNVGEQLGRTASTWRGEALHAVGAVAVGGAAVGAGRFGDGVGSPGLSLPALALLVLAVVLFGVALHE